MFLTRLPAPHLDTTASSTIIQFHRLADDAPRRLLRVVLLNDDCPPRGASRVASPGQAWLQIFNLALIPIVGIRPLDRSHQTRRTHDTKNLLPGARIAPSKSSSLFPLFSISHGTTFYYNEQRTRVHDQSTPRLTGIRTRL